MRGSVPSVLLARGLRGVIPGPRVPWFRADNAASRFLPIGEKDMSEKKEKDWIKPRKVSERVVPDRGTIRPGDIRLVDGVVSLVIREWDPGECWVVCPVKRLEEKISGRCL